MPQSPASPSHPVDFSELGRPRPKASPSVRALPPVPVAEPSGDLDELSADDILESDEIDSFEAAAAGIVSFEVPKAEPSGFEVGEVVFDEGDVRVEGQATSPAAPAPAAEPAAAAVSAPPGADALTAEAPKVEAPKVEAAKVEAATPASMKVDYVAPSPATLIGVPAAPVTSPMPLESVIVDDDSHDDSNVRTLELRGGDMSKVAAAAAALDQNEPQHTEVLKRSDMPSALHVQTVMGGMQAVHSPPPTSVYTPALDPNARAQAQRASSIDPMALDVAARGAMGAGAAHAPMPAAHAAYAPAPAKKPMTGLVIGGLALAAVALIGLVGIGGFTASRALADKTEPGAASTAQTAAEGNAAAPAAAPAAATAAPAAADPAAVADPAAAAEPAAAAAGGAADPASPATLDVSSLPAAPVAGAAPRAVSGGSAAPAAGERSGSGTTAAAPRAAAGSPLATSGRSSTSSGIKTTALPPPGAAPVGGSTPLPPPAAAAAPARAASQSRTGIVRVEPNLRAVVVDGSYRRATDGVLVISCGTHRIKAGMGETQTVNVPCGGSVAL